MKKILLPFFLCIISNVTFAQTMQSMFPKDAVYYIENGQQITYNKIDSVITSWGGKFNIAHQKDRIVLSPTSAADSIALNKQKAKMGLMVGQPAPDFSIKDVKGHTISLKALKGKVIVLNFWFTTCLPCIAEMPELNKLQQRFVNENVIFVGLGRDTPQEINAFLTQHEFNYILVPNAAQLANTYQVSVYPTSVVIDQNGIIKYVQITGEKVAASLSESIQGLL